MANSTIRVRITNMGVGNNGMIIPPMPSPMPGMEAPKAPAESFNIQFTTLDSPVGNSVFNISYPTLNGLILGKEYDLTLNPVSA